MKKTFFLLILILIFKGKVFDLPNKCFYFESKNEKNVPFGHMYLIGFKNFSQLNFNCVSSMPQQIFFKPLDFCSLDSSLRIINSNKIKKFYFDLNFFYLSSIDLNHKIYQDLSGYRQIFLKFFYSKLKIFSNHTTNCSPINPINLDIKTSFLIQFSYSVVYSLNTCPLLFSSITISNLEFHGLCETFIKKNVFGFNPNFHPDSKFNVKSVSFFIYKTKIDKKLFHSNLYEKCNGIRFVGMADSISVNAFDQIVVNKIYFDFQKLQIFFKMSLKWLTSYRQNLMEIVINSEELLNFRNEDLCSYNKMPINKFYLLTINQFYGYNKCECVMLVLFKNYFFLYNESFNFKLTQYGYGTFNKLLTIGCFNQTFIDSCNLNEKLKLCHEKKINFDSIWQDSIEKSQLIDFISVLLSQTVSVLGLILNFINLVILKSIIFDKNFKKILVLIIYKLMLLNSLINFTYLLINAFHIINRCVSLNGIFCSKFYTTKAAQYFDIFIVEYLGNVLKLWSAISLIAMSIIRLNLLKNKFKRNRLMLKIIFFILFFLSFVINVDKLIILRINISLDLLDWNEDHEFPDRNTFLLNFIQDRALSREIFYENSQSLIFYILFFMNFLLNDVLFFILLSFFEIFVLKVFIFKMKVKKMMAVKFKFSKSKITRIELLQMRITIIILGNTIILFFLRALHLYINASIFLIKLEPNHLKKNICFIYSKLCTNYQEASEILNIFSNSYNFFIFYFMNKNFRIMFWICLKKYFFIGNHSIEDFEKEN